MDLFETLIFGFTQAGTLTNLTYCFAGVLLGTLVGVLPGLGPLATVSILLPLTYNIGTPLSSIIFLSGIYYGSQYGGSTTAILLKLPGEASSLVTILDGHKMSTNGRAGSALAIAAISSFVAGTIATLLIALLAVPLADIALKFGPAEYTAVLIMGLVVGATITNGDTIGSFFVLILGMLFGVVGTDIGTGITRFGLGIPELYDGISLGVLAMAIFGLTEVLWNLLFQLPPPKVSAVSLSELYPTRQELKDSTGATMRGTLIGSIMGMLPGVGVTMASFFSYAFEKQISKKPEKFGTGVVEGLAAPEAANNAGSQTGFIPMLSLGIPTTPLMALMLGALMMQQIQPGPQVIATHPELFWGLVASMWIGNIILLILNLPLVGLWVKVLQVPRHILFPAVIAACLYGAYSLDNNMFHVWLLIPFTLLGFLLRWLDINPTPMALGFMIGPMLEVYLRRAFTISHGDWTILFHSPISIGFYIITALALMFKVYTISLEHKKTND